MFHVETFRVERPGQQEIDTQEKRRAQNRTAQRNSRMMCGTIASVSNVLIFIGKRRADDQKQQTENTALSQISDVPVETSDDHGCSCPHKRQNSAQKRTSSISSEDSQHEENSLELFLQPLNDFNAFDPFVESGAAEDIATGSWTNFSSQVGNERVETNAHAHHSRVGQQLEGIESIGLATSGRRTILKSPTSAVNCETLSIRPSSLDDLQYLHRGAPKV
jgi:hypothetical protein